MKRRYIFNAENVADDYFRLFFITMTAKENLSISPLSLAKSVCNQKQHSNDATAHADLHPSKFQQFSRRPVGILRVYP